MRYQKPKYSQQQERRTGGVPYPAPDRLYKTMYDAANAVIEFARSNHAVPTRGTVDAVNLYLKPVSDKTKHLTMETIVSHRTLMSGKLSILTIRELNAQQHEKADKALFDIANSFARITKRGYYYQAEISHDGHTVTVDVNRAVANDFHKGFLSISDLLNMSNYGVIKKQRHQIHK